MQRECPKCGHLNLQATGDHSEACPQCGVIYSKAAQLRAQTQLAHQVRSRQQDSTNNPSGLQALSWWLAIAGALLGIFQLIYTIITAKDAAAQATGTAIALGLTVIPYCLARAVSTLFRR